MAKKTEPKHPLPRCPGCGRSAVIWIDKNRINYRERPIQFNECGICNREKIEGDFKRAHQDRIQILEKDLVSQEEWDKIKEAEQ